MVIAVPRIFLLFSSKENVDFSAFQNDISKFEKNIIKDNDSIKHKNFDYDNVDRSVAENKLNPFYFNPNNLPVEKWKELGFDDKQIRIIKNYEAKGGKFYKKEDLKKIYGISESEYAVLEPYIQIPEEHKNNKKEFTPFKNEKNSEVIELNSADTAELKKLKGIGSYYAKKIIVYRTKLGGFYKKEQLLEVKGIDSARYAGFSDYISINKFLVRTININTATFDELKSHPYLNYNIANSLINLRKVHGKFNSVADIKKSALITELVYEKISPYLSVE
jgi:competence ComEA-like helix-hairpin-helix protein